MRDRSRPLRGAEHEFQVTNLEFPAETPFRGSERRRNSHGRPSFRATTHAMRATQLLRRLPRTGSGRILSLIPHYAGPAGQLRRNPAGDLRKSGRSGEGPRGGGQIPLLMSPAGGQKIQSGRWSGSGAPSAPGDWIGVQRTVNGCCSIGKGQWRSLRFYPTIWPSGRVRWLSWISRRVLNGSSGSSSCMNWSSNPQRPQPNKGTNPATGFMILVFGFHVSSSSSRG